MVLVKKNFGKPEFKRILGNQNLKKKIELSKKI